MIKKKVRKMVNKRYLWEIKSRKYFGETRIHLIKSQVFWRVLKKNLFNLECLPVINVTIIPSSRVLSLEDIVKFLEILDTSFTGFTCPIEMRDLREELEYIRRDILGEPQDKEYESRRANSIKLATLKRL